MTNTQYIKNALENLKYFLYGSDMPITQSEKINRIVKLQISAQSMTSRLETNTKGVRSTLIQECECALDNATKHILSLESQIKR